MHVQSCVFLAAFLLAACTPTEEEPAVEPTESGGEEIAEGPEGSPAPDSFSETAWMVRAEDGARYVTQFDADGTYRDLRNGDPWQQGGWSFAEGPEGKQLCFKPKDEAGVERCWLPGRMKGDTMIARGPGDRRIELQRVEYEPLADEGDAEE